MPTIATGDGTQIYYKDWGPKDAQPIVLHHGWPLVREIPVAMTREDWDL